MVKKDSIHEFMTGFYREWLVESMKFIGKYD